MSSRTLTVLTSVGSLRDARRIARALVEQQLAACVHIAPIESVYRWKGRLEREREFQLSMQTTATRAAALQSALRTLHPYELPALYVVAPARVDARYARWVAQSCAPARVRRAARPEDTE
jgi:periplasmic divalent cation tolerance protein